VENLGKWRRYRRVRLWARVGALVCVILVVVSAVAWKLWTEVAESVEAAWDYVGSMEGIGASQGYIVGDENAENVGNAESSEADLTLQEKLAGSVIRFHVRANSDTESDQILKMQVKAAVVEMVEPLLENSANVDESREILAENKEAIKMCAVETLAQNGCFDEVSVYFERTYFPAKTYGDVTFPPGEYEAFRIDIGEAQGQNWWCVLYPPLCFVDSAFGVLPEESKQELKNILTEYEYNAITEKGNYRFKYLKFLNFIFE
jgi:stage II sporulation protein R